MASKVSDRAKKEAKALRNEQERNNAKMTKQQAENVESIAVGRWSTIPGCPDHGLKEAEKTIEGIFDEPIKIKVFQGWFGDETKTFQKRRDTQKWVTEMRNKWRLENDATLVAETIMRKLILERARLAKLPDEYIGKHFVDIAVNNIGRALEAIEKKTEITISSVEAGLQASREKAAERRKASAETPTDDAEPDPLD